MKHKPEFVVIPAPEMQLRFEQVLSAAGFAAGRAKKCAEVFTQSSIDGVYTHGVNRFSSFIGYVRKGFVKANAEPQFKSASGNLEQWDGQLGPGILNAIHSTERAMALSANSGIGCVALSNTNHWMRGGSYGWLAAKAGYAFVGFTNTIANMPAWRSSTNKLGNNPLVIAVPYENEAIVLDMAMSQFSFGAMELARSKNERLPVAGGYDRQGRISDDPAAIIESRRPLPIGFWKGAGLSLMLDLLASVLSGGDSTCRLSSRGAEYGLSQVFIAINIKNLENSSAIPAMIEFIIHDFLSSEPVTEDSRILYPGQRVLEARERNLREGIPVIKSVWEEIMAL